MSTEQIKAALELIEAARPFLDSQIVDETDGTIPLMNRLEAAIEAMQRALIESEQR